MVIFEWGIQHIIANTFLIIKFIVIKVFYI